MRGPPIEVMEQGAERALAYLNAMHRATAVGGIRGAPAPPTRELLLDGFDPPPLPRTKWTLRVPHPVLIGHAASLSQVRRSLQPPRPDGPPGAPPRPAPRAPPRLVHPLTCRVRCRDLDRALSPPLPLPDTPPRNTTPAPCSSRAPCSAIPGAPAGGRAQRRARLRIEDTWNGPAYGAVRRAGALARDGPRGAVALAQPAQQGRSAARRGARGAPGALHDVQLHPRATRRDAVAVQPQGAVPGPLRAARTARPVLSNTSRWKSPAPVGAVRR